MNVQIAKNTAVFLALLIIPAAAGCNSRSRQYEMRIGHPMAPGNNVTLGYEKFRDLVDRRSRKTVTIRIYPNALLGNDKATVLAVQRGDLEMASSSTPNLAEFIPEFQVFDLPYITSPEKQASLYRAMDSGRLGRYLDEVCLKHGLKVLMWSEYGYRNFASTKRLIRLPSDMVGLRIRTTQSPIEESVVRTLKARVASLTWADTYSALIRDEIDGEGNTFDLLYTAKHFDSLKYIVTSRHNYSMHVLVVNKKYWDELPEDVRSLLGRCARDALAYERTISERLEKQAEEAAKLQGITVVHLDENEKKAWRTALQPVWQEYKKKIPLNLLELVMETQRQQGR